MDTEEHTNSLSTGVPGGDIIVRLSVVVCIVVEHDVGILVGAPKVKRDCNVIFVGVVPSIQSEN
jgi:hypothetical protein